MCIRDSHNWYMFTFITGSLPLYSPFPNKSLYQLHAECLGGQNINCGSFCCPPLITSDLFDTRGNRRDQCCSTFAGRQGCCSGFENSEQFSTSQCDGQICPDFTNPDEVFNSNRRPRNECCRYFRGGCCTTEENDTLEILLVLVHQQEIHYPVITHS